MGYVEIAMETRDLHHGEPSVPEGLSIRPYRPGDEDAWVDIHASTGVYRNPGRSLFDREFGARPELLPERQAFVFRGEEPVATATAWIPAPLRGPEWGRVHWVAVVPSEQRRGLASALMRWTFESFRDLGCAGAFLTTGSENGPAVSLYLKLGFTPWVRSAEEERTWRDIMDRRA